MIVDRDYRITAAAAGFTINKRKGDDLINFPIEKARLRSIWYFMGLLIACTVGYGWSIETKTVSADICSTPWGFTWLTQNSHAAYGCASSSPVLQWNRHHRNIFREHSVSNVVRYRKSHMTHQTLDPTGIDYRHPSRQSCHSERNHQHGQGHVCHGRCLCYSSAIRPPQAWLDLYSTCRNLCHRVPASFLGFKVWNEVATGERSETKQRKMSGIPRGAPEGVTPGRDNRKALKAKEVDSHPLLY
jgi:hypothetical protein